MLSKVRKALKLRKLYSNWLLTLIEFELLRRTSITVKCRGNSFSVSRDLYAQLADLVDRGVVVGCTGGRLEVDTGKQKLSIPLEEAEHASWHIYAILKAIERGWRCEDGYWEKGGVKFAHMHVEIIGTFDDEEYGVVDVKGKQVVDVGAFVGDTSIYFALKGAERVYAIEPHPLAYEELVRNVSLNRLQGKVVPLNLAISYVEEYISIPPDLTVSTTPATLLRGPSKGRAGLKVRAKRLGDVVREYGIKPDVLKMDCEGCEYDVILRDYDAVSRFEQVMFEYHAYNVGVPASRLLEALGRQFSCELVNEQIYMKHNPNWDKSKIGAYYCVRKR